MFCAFRILHPRCTKANFDWDSILEDLLSPGALGRRVAAHVERIVYVAARCDCQCGASGGSIPATALSLQGQRLGRVKNARTQAQPAIARPQ